MIGPLLSTTTLTLSQLNERYKDHLKHDVPKFTFPEVVSILCEEKKLIDRLAGNEHYLLNRIISTYEEASTSQRQRRAAQAPRPSVFDKLVKPIVKQHPAITVTQLKAKLKDPEYFSKVDVSAKGIGITLTDKLGRAIGTKDINNKGIQERLRRLKTKIATGKK